MRRIASFFRLLIALSVIALVALSVFSLPSPYYEKLRYWVVYSQNPPARFEARMYVTYQFHTLNKPGEATRAQERTPCLWEQRTPPASVTILKPLRTLNGA